MDDINKLIKQKHILYIKNDKKEIDDKEFEYNLFEIEKKIKELNKNNLQDIEKNPTDITKISKPVKQRTPREFSVRSYIIESLSNKRIKNEKMTIKNIIKNKYGKEKLRDKLLINKIKNQVRNFISCVKKQNQTKVKQYEWVDNNYMLKNKKGQLNDPSSFSLINPIFVIGIILFCVPVVVNIIGEGISDWLSICLKSLGVLFIFAGFVVMMLNRKERVQYGY